MMYMNQDPKCNRSQFSRETYKISVDRLEHYAACESL